ncbi:hypothetical protein PUN28_002930 [Cardiocondyla obscurior]|uniref:Uncharacterized protein n=1 Tax=Cardiocondyla obscurior TaxID=286306 RepID=A0AAW2GX30_9HYME
MHANRRVKRIKSSSALWQSSNSDAHSVEDNDAVDSHRQGNFRAARNVNRSARTVRMPRKRKPGERESSEIVLKLEKSLTRIARELAAVTIRASR